MEVKVIASGSKGNMYVVTGDNESLIIEGGVKIDTFIKAIGGLNAVGCLVSHEHNDHKRCAEKASNQYGIPLYMSQGTLDGISKLDNANIVKSHDTFKVGKEFQVYAFDTEHDVSEPLGFLVYHTPSGKQVLFITDSYYSKYVFNDIDLIMVECNYNDDVLQRNIDKGNIDPSRYKRTLKSHFGLNNVIKFLNSCKLTNTKKIMLLHLSDGNSHEQSMIDAVVRATGKQTVAASPGVSVNI